MYARKTARAIDESENGPSGFVTAKAPIDLIARMRDIASANDRSFSAEVRRAMRDYVEAYEEEEAA